MKLLNNMNIAPKITKQDEKTSELLNPLDEQFSKILRYINANDNGILNNTLNIKEKGKNAEKNQKCLKEIQLYQMLNNNKLFEDYDKLHQPIYSHKDLDLIKLNFGIELAYARKMEVQQRLPLPIIKNIDDKTIILIHYTLDLNMAAALAEVLSLKNDIQTIILLDNKFDEKTGPVFFKPIENILRNIVIFRFVKNHISQDLAQIFKRGFFGEFISSIRELTIDSSKIQSSDLNMIIEQAFNQKCRLKYLGLANINLSHDSIEPLRKFVASTEFLLSLDVAWNKLNCDDTKILIEAALANKNLKHLNLSWNKISSLTSSDSNNNTSTSIITKGILILKEHLIIHSGLLHLNLSYTQLYTKDINLLCEGMKLSCSLMSVHLTGNRLDHSSIEMISKTLNAKKIISKFFKHQKEYICSIEDENYQTEEVGHFSKISEILFIILSLFIDFIENEAMQDWSTINYKNNEESNHTFFTEHSNFLI